MIGIDRAVEIMFDQKVFSGTLVSLRFMSEFDIKKAFRDKVKLTHPDRAVLLGRNISDLEKEFKTVNDAYEVILNYYNSFSKKSFVIKEENKHQKNNEKKTETKHYTSNKRSDFKCTSEMPNRKLRFSEYLFYRKMITWNQLIESIVFQKSRRPMVGELAVSIGFIDREDLLVIIKNVKPNEKFCDAAIRLGFIDLYKLYVILGTQRKYAFPIGRYFVFKRILSKEKLKELLIENKKWNMRFI